MSLYFVETIFIGIETKNHKNKNKGHGQLANAVLPKTSTN